MSQHGDRRLKSRQGGDDNHMPTGARLVGVLAGVVCLVAVALMLAAAFLPYTGWYGDGLLTADEYPLQVSVSLIGGTDVWFVLGTIVTLGVFAARSLAGVSGHVTGFFALGASLVALGLALKLPGTSMQDGMTYGQPYVLDAGFYVFLGGAVTAVVGSLLMVVTGFVSAHSIAGTPLYPSPS
jgi:hypothetical protein